jgi:hypothetical protein
LLENNISTHGKRPPPQNGRAFLSGNIEKELQGMEKISSINNKFLQALSWKFTTTFFKKIRFFYSESTFQVAYSGRPLNSVWETN